ncbi:MAG TPA: DUF6602 domain-containing protein [Terriglobales bacterium]|nr:DUF6602 domain-containing protein [Terriglobales bacterium]
MNDQLKARLKGIQDVLMSHYHGTKLLPTAAKGDEREVLVRDFLEKVFPLPYRFGSGVVIDGSGGLSGQLDVIVEWPFFASFPAPEGKQRLYLAESVAFAIELKSDLCAQWRQVKNTIKQLSPLRRHWQGALTCGPAGGMTEHDEMRSRIPCVVVGFTGHKTIASLHKQLTETPEEERPDAALIIESGFYVNRWAGPVGAAEVGFLACCFDGSYFVRNVVTAVPNVTGYLGL